MLRIQKRIWTEVVDEPMSEFKAAFGFWFCFVFARMYVPVSVAQT